MLVLVGFAILAGAATAVSPCVLPVLPAVLSAGSTGGRRRPLGIVLGLTATFTVAIVALASVINGVGLAHGLIRTLAIVVLAGFGLTLLLPAVGGRLEARLSRVGSRWAPSARADGFWSGVALGGALGFLYAPCAGPILAAVISVSATQGTSLRLITIGLAYGAGSGIVLLVLALGGRRISERLRAAGRGAGLQRSFGAVMVATAVVMVFNGDIRLETALARHAPSFLVNPTGSVERSAAVQRRLASLRGRARFEPTHATGLRSLGRAPEFIGTQRWFNTGGTPLSLAGLRGRVVLVDFWTYTCINCLRTLPYLEGLDRRYRRDGLTIVGVHTPEFAFEHNASNVASAIHANGIRYPVVQDNDYATWNAYGNQYWPAEYLIDARGNVRHVNFGEGGYAKTEAAVRALLAEAGARRLGGRATGRAQRPTAGLATPETYLGTGHPQPGLVTPLRAGVHRYPGWNRPLALSRLALGGTWSAGEEASRSVRAARLDFQVRAADVYAVLSKAKGASGRVRVLLDGRPISARESGADVREGLITVREQRLYRLVHLPRDEERRLTLEPAPGVSIYAFTFG